METDNVEAAPSPQLLFLGQKSTKRLLEVYVKRSLSLNDSAARRQRVKPRKWIIVDNKGNRIRKASSDSSTHRLSHEISQTDQPKEPSSHTTSDSHQTESNQSGKKPGTHRITKKPSILRSFLRLFSRKNYEVPNGSVPNTPVSSGSLDSCFEAEMCPPVSKMSSEDKEGNTLCPTKSIKKRLSLKKLSFRSDSVKRNTSLATADVVRVPDAIVCVEPSNTYFEKVSEELERIVKELKESPTEDEAHCAATLTDQRPAEDSEDDIVERMVNILKQQGDEINEKIRRNSSMSSFFQKLTYNNFQLLADRYVADIPDPLPQRATTPPQLVKLAFTLDFTAKVAGLSSQAVGRIMGFGNQYIQNRFTQMTSVNCQESQNLEDLDLVD